MVEAEDRLVQSRVPYIHSREGNAELEYIRLSKDTIKMSLTSGLDQSMIMVYIHLGGM